MSSINQWKYKPTCRSCEKKYNIPYLWCPECLSIIEIPPIKGSPRSNVQLQNMWSFDSFLPRFKRKISLYEGGTPLFSLRNSEYLPGLKVKCEFRNPTGSFRDRASSLLLSDLKSREINQMINASTGSFSISLAAYCAHAQSEIITVVPDNIELSKIEQLQLYGAQVMQKGSNLSAAAEYVENLISKKKVGDYYSPLPNENLLTIIGQKTIGLELSLQLKQCENVIIPRGSGTMIYSIYKGLQDAIKSEWITEMPRLFAVSLEETKDAHLAESLAMKSNPELVKEVDFILNETGGKTLAIKGNQMIEDAMELAKSEGIFIEPASASVLSATKDLFSYSEIDKGKTAVILSGSGINAMNVFASRLREVDKVVWGISKRSTTRFEILNLINSRKATYGSAIGDSLSHLNLTIGNIYQHLQNMEREGLIFDEQPEKRKKQFSLTTKGKKILESLKEIMELQPTT